MRLAIGTSVPFPETCLLRLCRRVEYFCRRRLSSSYSTAEIVHDETVHGDAGLSADTAPNVKLM
jgi:hypothetical protein